MLSFGYNSFWNFMHGSPAVQELLNKPDLTIDDLLEEDGLLIELKSLNQKLLNFLLQEDNFKQLTQYVIQEPDVEEAKVNQKKCYKYPFICADVLSSDSQAIVSEFFKTKQDLKESTTIHKAEEAEDNDEVTLEDDSTEKEQSTETSTVKDEKSTTEDKEEEGTKSSDANEFPYLDYLFTFLDAKEMNLTSAGYFAKIVNNLFSKKPSALITYLYEIKPQVLENMVNHIASKSIAEFLAKVLTFDSSVLVSTEDEIYNTKRNEVLQLVIKKLDPKSDIEEINNTAYLICEVLGKYNTMHCSHEILQNLLERTTIDYFFELLKTKDSVTCCAVALILGNIFAYYILINTPKVHSSEDGEDENQNEPQQLELTEAIPLVAAFEQNLESIIQYICNTSGNTFVSQFGAEVVPFGSARLKLIELIIIALKANNKNIYTKLIEYQFLEGLLSLFVKYEWNNMLHNQIEKIIGIILDSNYDELKTTLFVRIKLLDFLIDTCKQTEYTLPGKHERKIVRGYSGQVTKMANRLKDSQDPIVIQHTEDHEGWADFVENVLAKINEKNDTKLGEKYEEDEANKYADYLGYNRNHNDNDDDDDEQNDDDLNRAQDQDEDEDEEIEEDEDEKDKPYEHIFPEDKHTLKFDTNSHEVRGRASFGFKQHHDEAEEVEIEESQDVDKYSSIMAGSLRVVENVKQEEQILDPEYNTNSVFQRQNWHSADDILNEIEGL